MRKKPKREPIPNPYLDERVVDNVPVVNPNTTAPTVVGLGTVATMIVLWVVNHYVGPMNAEQLAVVVSAINILVGTFTVAYQRYFANKVSVTAVPKTMRIRLRTK